MKFNNSQELSSEAQNILNQNWRNGFTIPTSKLYPFQWNWDSGFTSIGLAHFNIDRAIIELQSLFSGQWKNGMLPHIIFHSEKEDTYFPNFDFWDSSVNTGAPQQPKSSGITQPAVHGFVLEELLERYPTNEKLQGFAKEIFPKIVNNHRFFYTYRDPKSEGLTSIIHPWESGRDNSPLWDESMKRIIIDKSKLPAYERKDTKLASADERPTSRDYDRYVYLLALAKKYKYDEPAIFEECPFLIQDTLMNAILIRSNQSLIRIGEMLGFDVGEIKEWQSQAKKAFSEKLWSDELETYCAYDLRAEQLIMHREIGGLTALYAGIADVAKAKRMEQYLVNLHNRGFYLCPSFDVDSPLFDSKRYWRGPIWPQMNWMIYQGLKRYDLSETANIVKNDLLELVSKQGFYEYFESQKSLAEDLTTGYGGGNFSWTAACAMDLSKEITSNRT